MPYFCTQCGECCQHLGLVHVIAKQIKDDEFLLRNEYTGEINHVFIDPDKKELFLDKSIFETYPDSCPCFRFQKTEKKGYCTCHLTRPTICHDYNCWRILILDQTGARVGRIMGWRHLCAEHEDIGMIWEDNSQRLSSLSDSEWDIAVIRLFQMHGYRVIR